LPISRRTFLEQSAALAVVQSMPGMKMQQAQNPHGDSPTPNPPHVGPPALQTLALAPFVDALPLPEIIRANGKPITMTMREISAKVHRDVPATRMWSYGPNAMAPLIEARAHEPLTIHWVNNLPQKHFLPIDYSLHGSGHDVPDVRTVAHMHGAKAQSKDDGYPTDWFATGHTRTCVYPMQQEATALWFHDHAMGINRLNTYAGLFGMLLLRDQTEDALNLPSGVYEIPLALYDRDFTRQGQLLYEESGDPVSPWIPEFQAEGILINGMIRPYLEVEPRLYRFRVVNVANSRFFTLSLANGQAFHQIGTDQGLLAAPVEVKRTTVGCAERADLLIDFSHLAGQTTHLRTGAFDILELRVKAKTSSPSHTMPKAFRPIQRIPESASVKTRTITLHDYKDNAERSMVMLLNRKRWHEPTTEFPRLNTTEIWEFMNLTDDTHPMHLHLVRFQILDRRTFDAVNYLQTKNLRYTAPAEPPAANEDGWKDVVQCPSGMITRIIVPFEGYTGKYLYHCHILEHEANDMMRPFEVVA
jgi:spore coat protein A